MAQPRFTNRPSARRITWRPFFSVYLSTYNRHLVFISKNIVIQNFKTKPCDLVIFFVKNVHLWLYVILVCTIVIQPFDIEFTVKMSNVTHNCILWHLEEHLALNYILASCGRYNDARSWQCIFYCSNFITLNNVKLPYYFRYFGESSKTTDRN